MHSATYKSLLLSIFILLMAVLTGFLLSQKIISNELSHELLKLETFAAVTIFSLQIFVYSRAKTQLFYQLLFIGFFGFSLILMLVSLFLPLFWVKHLAVGWKFLIASIFIGLAIFNVFLAFRLYKKRWAEVGRREFDILFKQNSDLIDWNQIQRVTKISIDMLFPGINQVWSDIITLIMFALLFVGCALRGPYPVLGMATWALPFSLCAMGFLQASAYNFAQAQGVRLLQRQCGMTFKSVVWSGSRPKPKKRKRSR